eukprot:1616363-Rhodomonas_salina.2
MLLRASRTMSGSEIGYAATRLGGFYTVSLTCVPVAYPIALPAPYRPRHLLGDARYSHSVCRAIRAMNSEW